MKAYILRDIPEKTWQQTKHIAIEENTSARLVVIRALEEYVEKRLDLVEAAKGGKQHV